MKKILIALLLFIGLLATPSYAHGDNTTSLPQVPQVKLQIPGKISPMNVGDKAPYNGVLFSVEAASFILALPQHNAELLQIEVLNTQQVERAECTKKLADENTRRLTDAKITKAEFEEASKRIAILTEKIKEDEKKNTPNVWLWATGGFVTGIAATVVTIYAVKQM